MEVTNLERCIDLAIDVVQLYPVEFLEIGGEKGLSL